MKTRLMRLRPAFWLCGFVLCVVLLTGCQPSAAEESFYFGVDLSYVNEMDNCGAVYREDGKPQDAFILFQQHGANLVRARLWHTPTWTDYSTLADVKKTFTRAREAGMSTLLDIHYSDDWADPSKQHIPAAWEGMNDDELAGAVYEYTVDVLTDLHAADLMPTFIQIGNETNSGMLKDRMDLDWPRDAAMFNAGIRAVREVAKETDTEPKIIIHIAQPENTGAWFSAAQANGLTDFDVIGVSYYPQWSGFSIADMGGQVNYLRQTFGKEVIVVETAYPWTYDSAPESASNLLTEGAAGYAATPAGQRQFMIDLTQSLISNGALGVVYWEPAWVSTECTTRWGQGSHWENATFFDFQNDNELLEGIDFLSYDYYRPGSAVDAVVGEAYGEVLIADGTGDVLSDIAALDLVSLHAAEDGASVSLALTISGDITAQAGNSYLVYFDTTHDARGASADAGERPITVVDPFKPEFRLDTKIVEENDTISGRFMFYAWDGAEWQRVTFTGGVAIQSGEPSVIEFQIPRILMGNPAFVNVIAASTDRALIHTAFDVTGTDHVPVDWSEPVVLDSFGHLEINGQP
jgi:arabinogalactan endo-1,4-beta-galactosidase